ncbi:hypothetical protein D9M68_855230 [compost metagenome]
MQHLLRAVADLQAAHLEQQALFRGSDLLFTDIVRRRLHRRQQAAGIGMLGFFEDLLGAAVLLDLAVTQDDDAVSHLRHDREVVGYVDRRRIAFAHHLFERAQHFDLRRHIQRRRRLIENHQCWISNQRHGGHQTLQLPTRYLVRIARANPFWLR